jgi:hypothetical protein
LGLVGDRKEKESRDLLQKDKEKMFDKKQLRE